MNIVVAHPDCLDRCKQLNGGWIYADDDSEIYERCKSSLQPGLRPAVSPAEFQAAVVELRKDFVAWVDRNLRNKVTEQWLLSPLYKNPYSSDLLLHISWLFVLNKLIRDHKGDFIVITKSLGLCRALREFASDTAEFRCLGHWRMWIRQLYFDGKAIAGTFWRFFQLLIRMVLARVILGRRYEQTLTGIDLMVAGFVHDADISEDGVFKDRYFPGLIEWYREQGFSVAEYPTLTAIPFIRLASIYRRIKLSSTPFVLFEQFTHFTDVIAAAGTCLRHIFTRSDYLDRFCGVDANPMTRTLKFRFALGGLVPVVLTKAPLRIANAGIRPQWLIMWYENQPPDKATVIGFRRANQQSQTIAVRQYDWVPNLLSQYCTTTEVEVGVSPKQNWVCGEAMRDGTREYDLAGSYRTVPALRYAHLYDDDEYQVESEPSCLTVLLTVSIRESLAILQCVVEALPGLRGLFSEIRVKPHPDVGIGKMLSIAGSKWEEANRLVWDNQPLAQLLRRSTLVVSAGTSSAVEAICFGLPVIVIGRSAGLNMNPLETFDRRLWRVVYDDQGLLEAVAEWTPHPVPFAKRTELGRAIRDFHFQRVSPATMMSFSPSFQLAHASA